MKKFWQMISKKDAIFVTLMIVLAAIVGLTMPESVIEVTFGETAVDIVHEKYAMNIPYDMVESVELAEMPEPGKCIDGLEARYYYYGVWVNEAWGEYTICSDRNASNVVLVHLKDGRLFVFSRLDNAETENLCHTFRACLES